jgi:hypothetical protein
MNAKLKLALVGLLLLGLGYGVGKFSNPAKVVTRTEFKEKIKVVEVIKEQKNVVVITKKTTKKDGTIIEESKTEDKSTTYQDKHSESKKEISSSTVTTRDIGLSVHAMAMQNIGDLEQKREYGIFVKKRVIGNISVGGLVTDQKTIGLSVGMDF